LWKGDGEKTKNTTDAEKIPCNNAMVTNIVDKGITPGTSPYDVDEETTDQLVRKGASIKDWLVEKIHYKQ
jgi:hypothetical protein